MRLKTKFNIGYNVWFMSNNKPTASFINTIAVTVSASGDESVDYGFYLYPNVPQSMVFKTKALLFASL